MINKVNQLFNFLDDNCIKYLLLRPIDFEENFEDVDLIMPYRDFNKLLDLVSKNFQNVFLKYSNANGSIQLFLDNILLDIKFDICFLPRKSLIFKHDIPYGKVLIKEGRYLYPVVEDEVLFTFWTFHIFLDKKNPLKSSTYQMYKNLYFSSWEFFITSDYFIKWTEFIFHNNNSRAISYINLFFKNDMMLLNKNDNKKIQNLAIISNKIILKFYFDKYYYKLLRISGSLKRRRSILEIKKKLVYEI
jgi:hypothetical protein|tara:strand:- start:3549 stop:4286 length:738 start_codon:yes stop_codon:yes gene_type:complete